MMGRDSSRAPVPHGTATRVESPHPPASSRGDFLVAVVSASKWPSRLVVMRHAESLATERRRHLEQIHSTDVHLGLDMRDVDVPLTPEGREHARLTGARLNEWGPFDVLYVSPYRRTRETAEEVLGELEQRPVVITE